MARWFYSGDRDLHCGGLFYRLDGWRDGYFDAVHVIPCSDAGGQDNAWWIEALTGIVPRDAAEAARVLSCIGADLQGLTPAQKRHAIVDACIAYGLYDPANCYPDSSSETVQIGPRPDDCGNYGWRRGRPNSELVKPTVVLRGNASLERYVRREFLNRRM